MSDLLKARTEPEIYAAVAAGAWARDGRKGDPETPTREGLAEWWPTAPDTNAADRLQGLARIAQPDAPPDLIAALSIGVLTMDGKPLTDQDGRPLFVAGWPVVHNIEAGEPGSRLTPCVTWLQAAAGIELLHRHWVEAMETHPDECPRHPLAPIVKAWLNRPTPAKVYNVTERASLPDFGRDGAHLIDPDWIPDAFEAKDPQPFLPGFEPDGGPLPHWLLHWFRATGGPISQGGRLPMELSVMVGGMARVAIPDRDGRWRTIHVPHRIEHEERFGGVHSVERWLWPDGRNKGDRYSRWYDIPEALDRLRRGWAGWLAIPGLGRVAVLAPSVIPEARTDPLVELTVRIPASAAHGARFGWLRFARYAVESATLARGYLSAVAHLHRSAHKGHPVTRMIAAPIIGPDGQPVRRKGGAIARSATEVVANPQARFVPTLTDFQLARGIGYSEADARHWRKRARAREVFERLAADGVIDLRRAGKTFRVFGPS